MHYQLTFFLKLTILIGLYAQFNNAQDLHQTTRYQGPPPYDMCEQFLTTTAEPIATKMPTTCILNQTNCLRWDIYASVFNMNEGNLTVISNFMSETVASCTSQSKFQLIIPNQTNHFLRRTEASQDEVEQSIQSLRPEEYVVDETGYVVAIVDMFSDMKTTLVDQKTVTSAVVFMFTDLTCKEFCSSGNLRDSIPQSLVDLVSLLYNHGYVVNLFSTSDTAGNALEECSLVLDPQHIYPVKIPTNIKDMDRFQICANLAYADPDETTTVPAESGTHKGLSNDDVVWIVLGALLVAVLCAACLIKLLFNCDGPREKISNTMRGWLDKYDRKKFGETAFSAEVPREQSSNKGQAVRSNSYMEIEKLADQNRSDVWELPIRNLFIHETEILGSGAFAQVYKGTVSGTVPLLKTQQGVRITLDHGHDGFCEAAVKRLPPHADKQNRMDFFHEMQFMKLLGYHVHVIPMLGCVSDPEDPLILVEYCQHGDLLQFLRTNRQLLKAEDEFASTALRMKNLVSISWQISDGLSYLHSKNFIHRDIAARNVLLTKNLVVKISDFGLCRQIDSALYTAKGGRLPIKWMAIESLKFYEYSSQTDMWAFGVTMWEIFSLGDGPFQAIQPLEVLQHLENGNRLPKPEKCPKEIYEVLTKCWKEEANERPTANDVKSDLMSMLYSEDENYGYLAIPSQFDRPPIVITKPSSDPGNHFKSLSDKLTREPVLNSSEDAILESLHEESRKLDKFDYSLERRSSDMSIEFYV